MSLSIRPSEMFGYQKPEIRFYRTETHPLPVRYQPDFFRKRRCPPEPEKRYLS